MVLVVFFLFFIFLVFCFFFSWIEFCKEESSSYECGFDVKDSARVPFSLRFFSFLLLFLLFDLELIFLLQTAKDSLLKFSGFLSGYVVFLLTLMGTMYIEHSAGLLSWTSH